MTKHLYKNQKGAAIIIYLLVMAIVVTVLMVGTYSRLLLALKRGQSTTDSLIINYSAESEINDWIARLSEKYIKMNPFSVNETKTIGDTNLKITGTQNGGTQTIVIEADRPYASTKITAERKIENLGSDQAVDIMIGLDCTSSMNTVDGGDTKTRISNLRTAAINFVNAVPLTGNYRIGVFVFGIDGQWMKTAANQDITLTSGLTPTEVSSALQTQLGDTIPNSPACKTVIQNTSVGTGFVFSQDYLKTQKSNGHKQVEIIITDGEPNSRIPYAGCAPSVYCPARPELCNVGGYGGCYPGSSSSVCTPLAVEFLRCSVADTNTTLPNSFDKGVRDPDITTYAVTISTSPSGPAATVLKKYLGDNYIGADRAGQLNTILSGILNNILSKRETITIHKDIPGS